MTDMFVFNYTELLGYVGGLILALALAPQVYHTYRTRSTRDISYGWQGMYLIGLILSYAYFFLSGVTAAWVTLSIELLMALFLFGMKVRNDGCGGGRDGCRCRRSRRQCGQCVPHSDTKSIDHSNAASISDDEELGLQGDANTTNNESNSNTTTGSTADDPTVDSLGRRCGGGSHVIVTVTNEPSDNTAGLLPVPLRHHFTEALVLELKRLAAVYQIALSCPHVDMCSNAPAVLPTTTTTLTTTTAAAHHHHHQAATGFVVSALLGHSYISIVYHSPDEMLSLEFHSHCGPRYQQTQQQQQREQEQAVSNTTTDLGRTIVRDMVVFLKQHVSSSHAKFVVHNITTGSSSSSSNTTTPDPDISYSRLGSRFVSLSTMLKGQM